MIVTPRSSQISTDNQRNQIAIVHREGNQLSYYILAAIFLLSLVIMVIVANNLRLTQNFSLFAILVLIGLLVFIIETIVIRHTLYSAIIHNQGLQHPKLIITLIGYLFTLFPPIPEYIRFIMIVTLLLVSIDVFMQNQMHDIISIIRPNYWELITAIPIFHIPFRRQMERYADNDTTFLISTKIIQSGQESYLSDQEITDLLHTDQIEKEIDYIELYNINPDSVDSNQLQIVLFARLFSLDQFRDLIAGMNNLIEMEFVHLAQ